MGPVNGVMAVATMDHMDREGNVPGATSGAYSPWTEAELEACVVAYQFLWEAQRRGEVVNKTDLRRSVLTCSLQGRSAGSYEFRMQNISAVLDELGFEWAAGYLPRRNIGKQRSALTRLVVERWGLNQRSGTS